MQLTAESRKRVGHPYGSRSITCTGLFSKLYFCISHLQTKINKNDVLSQQRAGKWNSAGQSWIDNRVSIIYHWSRKRSFLFEHFQRDFNVLFLNTRNVIRSTLSRSWVFNYVHSSRIIQFWIRQINNVRQSSRETIHLHGIVVHSIHNMIDTVLFRITNYGFDSVCGAIIREHRFQFGYF